MKEFIFNCVDKPPLRVIYIFTALKLLTKWVLVPIFWHAGSRDNHALACAVVWHLRLLLSFKNIFHFPPKLQTGLRILSNR